MATAESYLDQLAADERFYGLNITTKLESGRWCAAFRTKELPSVSGGPMYTAHFGQTPTEAIENGAKALLEGPAPGSPSAEAIDELI